MVIEVASLSNGPRGASFYSHLEECAVCRAFYADEEEDMDTPPVFEWGGIIGGSGDEEEEEE